MRFLERKSNGDLVFHEPSIGDFPAYAILSHTWLADNNEEVSFQDVQAGTGKSKAGWKKIQFCADKAVADGLRYFWIDTCCISKDKSELSEAITRMFRWYQAATKCYVYLSDVSVRRDDNMSKVQSTWEPSFRNSRWFTRGWTLQELLAPDVVEFFSQEGEFLGTKQKLRQLIHEVTTLPLAALGGTPLTQFAINEKIRWTKKRQTMKPEDGAYCLLGIFDVFMPLIYGEGHNAFRRLREEINKQFGSNVAACPGIVDEVRSPELCRRLALLDDVDNFRGRASTIDAMGQASRPDEVRPTKRAGTLCDLNVSRSGKGRSHDNMTSSRLDSDGDHIQQSAQDAQHDATIDSEDSSHALLNSLLFDRIDFRVNNVKKPPLSTCQWLFCHPQFQTWYENRGSAQHNGFLWIKGKPGCGKSTLMKALLEWARKRKSKHHAPQTIIPYFFNARASASLEKSSYGLYRTVVHHLLSSYPNLRTLFAEKFTLKDPGQLGEKWTVEELQEFLSDTLESNESFELCLLIDALDEAEYEDDVRQMISFLVQLSDRALVLGSSCKLRICLSSRHYPHISIAGLSLVVENQPEHTQDIDYYITKQLTCQNVPEKCDLQAEILDKSAGIFLWVVLVVQILNKLDDSGTPLSDMRTRLKSIPANLKELFQQILMKSDVGIERSVLFFQWMVFCMRPLQPGELFVAMEYSRSPVDATYTPLMEITVPDPERLIRFILNCSRGLVEVVEVGASQSVTVQFIHETVREFLLRENGLASICQALATNIVGISHEILRIACLRRISMTAMPAEYELYCQASHNTNASLDAFRANMHLKLPFLDYAISYLFDHAEHAQQHNISQQTFLKDQIDADGLWLGQYRLWWNVLERYKSKKLKPGVTLIYFVAERKHLNLLTVLFTISDAINTSCGAHGSTLQMSSYHGYQEIVQILLDNGADVNAHGRVYGNALQAAIARGHEKIVQILLVANADPNAQGRRYDNTLQMAIARGHEKIVQMLLDAGANPNTHGRVYGNALQAAIARGHEKIVQILLVANADPNAQGGKYGNALQAASDRGHEKVVRLLRDSMLDPEL